MRVPAATSLAVQLEQGLVLSRAEPQDAGRVHHLHRGGPHPHSAQVLAQQNYYRGAINGQLDDATQRALFEFQIDKGIIATGNLDGRTAQALGLDDGGPRLPRSSRRRKRRCCGVERRLSSAGIVRTWRFRRRSSDGRRAYAEGDLELWFALSAFADNASFYEQLVRVSGNVEGSALAG